MSEMKEIWAASAVLAISNMGLDYPKRDKVQLALTFKRYNLDTFVVWFGEQYMENDHYDMFMAEAEMWVKLLSEEDDWKVGSWRWVYDDLIAV